MKYTSNHNFKLPAPSDTIDVEVLNENFVNIDSLIKTLESAKADKNSPSFTGAPTAPTASSSTNSTQIATTAFVRQGGQKFTKFYRYTEISDSAVI